MASAGNTPIQLYYSNTAGNVPPAANLIIGELALNVPDGKLYYLSSPGVVSSFSSNNFVVNQIVNNADTFTSAGSATFTLSKQPASANSVIVNLNGIMQNRSSYSVSGTTLTLTEVPYTGATIDVLYSYNTSNGVFVQTNNFLPIAFGPSGALTDVALVALTQALIAS
ncbi:hypothetical protein UFOVP250_211 [uncultured Caudovirales phage]|uniref:Uncharacterized protein n=1 Tax=uncultured Caudovirales phage TaxID=2100421 RepID=A0A6J5LFN8_9CAUD|nr:hypothetical protein UFOVP250_211 [uncultured Caudovirales phage]